MRWKWSARSHCGFYTATSYRAGFWEKSNTTGWLSYPSHHRSRPPSLLLVIGHSHLTTDLHFRLVSYVSWSDLLPRTGGILIKHLLCFVWFPCCGAVPWLLLFFGQYQYCSFYILPAVRRSYCRRIYCFWWSTCIVLWSDRILLPPGKADTYCWNGHVWISNCFNFKLSFGGGEPFQLIIAPFETRPVPATFFLHWG